MSSITPVAYTTHPLEIFDLIYKAVDPELNRLMPDHHTQGKARFKAQQIREALSRLVRVLIVKFPNATKDMPTLKRCRITIEKINPSDVENINLTTVGSMLTAEISHFKGEIDPWTTSDGMEFDGRREGYYYQISLRDALDISQNNIFNIFNHSWGPIWGKTNTLKNVENKLKIKEV
jgi:hypothetical protein